MPEHRLAQPSGPPQAGEGSAQAPPRTPAKPEVGLTALGARPRQHPECHIVTVSHHTAPCSRPGVLCPPPQPSGFQACPSDSSDILATASCLLPRLWTSHPALLTAQTRLPCLAAAHGTYRHSLSSVLTRPHGLQSCQLLGLQLPCPGPSPSHQLALPEPGPCWRRDPRSWAQGCPTCW